VKQRLERCSSLQGLFDGPCSKRLRAAMNVELPRLYARGFLQVSTECHWKLMQISVAVAVQHRPRHMDCHGLVLRRQRSSAPPPTQSALIFSISSVTSRCARAIAGSDLSVIVASPPVLGPGHRSVHHVLSVYVQRVAIAIIMYQWRDGVVGVE